MVAVRAELTCDLGLLENLAHLEALDLSELSCDTPSSPNNFQIKLPVIPSLRGLNMRGLSWFRGDGLANFPALEVLDLAQTQMDDTSIDKLTALTTIVSGCNKTPSPTPVASSLYSEERASDAAAVVRVKVESYSGGSSYVGAKVQVLQVLKNDTDYPIGEFINVSYLSAGSGLPRQECTIYLLPDLVDGQVNWLLSEPETTLPGFTHVQIEAKDSLAKPTAE